ncbi:hypothetical protein [Streptomyces sp. Ncost-T10-10d]|uniref:hypothetical protein n=1 Tax=Streptomyces sp. Ncost-T10-10d TaxID=1839774 RepID=UPI00081D4703|nr:hypothetical protein [Streptomyces sp. Ncost-T10-10d]SCF98945.1 hypothetical protein GA0115254_131587 [Streptomyces sp. Ncost-T10-10d]
MDSIRQGVVFHGPMCMPSVGSAPYTSCWTVVLRVRPPRLLGGRGWYVRPTLIGGLPNDAEINQEE